MNSFLRFQRRFEINELKFYLFFQIIKANRLVYLIGEKKNGANFSQVKLLVRKKISHL